MPFTIIYGDVVLASSRLVASVYCVCCRCFAELKVAYRGDACLVALEKLFIIFVNQFARQHQMHQ